MPSTAMMSWRGSIPKDNINDFEFQNPFESFTAPMKDIGYFLTGIYNSLGALNIPIGSSLTLTIHP